RRGRDAARPIRLRIRGGERGGVPVLGPSEPGQRGVRHGRWGTIPLQPLMHRSPVLVLVAVVLLSACSGSSSVAARPTPSQSGTQVLSGSIGAAAYVIDLPVDWNGTLFLYSHGYVAPGAANPASAAPD